MQPRLEMRHLAMLITVADAPSMAQAAALLGLTQSALSHRLREAERRLDARLFLREKKRLVLTPAGERLLLTARRLVTDLARAESDAMEIAHAGVSAVVRLGQSHFAIMPWYADFYAWARRRVPDLQVEAMADSADRPLDLLAEGALDVALVGGEIERPGVRKLALFEDSLVAIAPPGHRWAQLAAVQPDDIIEETFLSYGFAVTPGYENIRFMRASGRFPRHIIKVGSRPEALMDLVAAGEGVGIMAAWATLPLVAVGRLISRPLQLPGKPPGLPLVWHAAVRENDPADAPGPRLAATLVDWCRKTGGFSAVQLRASAGAGRAVSPRPTPARPRRGRAAAG
ncbi:MAG TPA: LysR family transcriptional regulator [Kiloniellales bacterium]|nr:LysR family transcriptional regulator [Kiloniellales bacterium]